MHWSKCASAERNVGHYTRLWHPSWSGLLWWARRIPTGTFCPGRGSKTAPRFIPSVWRWTTQLHWLTIRYDGSSNRFGDASEEFPVLNVRPNTTDAYGIQSHQIDFDTEARCLVECSKCLNEESIKIFTAPFVIIWNKLICFSHGRQTEIRG